MPMDYAQIAVIMKQLSNFAHAARHPYHYVGIKKCTLLSGIIVHVRLFILKEYSILYVLKITLKAHRFKIFGANSL